MQGAIFCRRRTKSLVSVGHHQDDENENENELPPYYFHSGLAPLLYRRESLVGCTSRLIGPNYVVKLVSILSKDTTYENRVKCLAAIRMTQ